MTVTLSMESESAVTCHWLNDLPVIPSVPMEGEGAKVSMTRVKRVS